MNYELNKISIKSAAEQLNVSVVSIHNWIKDGSLKIKDGRLTQECIDDFKRDFLNENKLSSRANKQYKDIHNHNQLTEDIRLKINSELSGKEISDSYESSLSESYKNKEGIYYTPQYIVEDMMRDITDVEGKTFLDPCCGSGNFIVEAIRKGFAPENVYGFDIDENAVAITKKRIKELCGYESDNIFCGDFLSQKPKAKSQKSKAFDYIFTNPPWGKKINKKDRDKYSDLFNSGNSNDTSSLFYFASLKMLKDDGMLGFLLPDAFFNITSFEDARKSLLTLDIKRLVDYGKPFKGLMTKAMAVVMLRQQVNEPTSQRVQSSTANVQQPIGQSIAVDAACSGNPGKMEFQGVFVETKTHLFKSPVYEHGTNNIGEFLAIVYCLAWQHKKKLNYPIYSDSVNAQKWVREGVCKTKIAENEKNKPLFEVIRWAEKWLKENSFRVPIYKWRTEIWGEIPADFGRK